MIPRRNLIIAGAILLLAFVWSIGTHDYTALVSGVLVFAFMTIFLWLRIRRRGRDG